MPSASRRILPFLLGAGVGAVMFALFLHPAHVRNDPHIDRFAEIVEEISEYYVEEVTPDQLVETAISGMLESLDPHTVYIPEERLEGITERFDGHFEGIGVEFFVQGNHPVIVSPIPNSPSHKLGIRPGDRLVAIDGQPTEGLSEDEVVARLRGAGGSYVEVGIVRDSSGDSLNFTISRDRIPLQSVLASFMCDDRTGFIRLAHFARTTEEEVEQALAKLAEAGMQQLILDLRGNTGGYLDQAIAVANKFVPAGKRIVSTRGRISQANDAYYATHDPFKTDVPLLVLIDPGSASASEIVAGAIQDLDRGLIVGERSFGKGLVQNQVGLNGGAAMRITVAQYFTPSGRPIQRAFDKGAEVYFDEPFADKNPGETPAESRQYFTERGRAVDGGGGIQPDVQMRWAERTSALTQDLREERLVFLFAADYVRRHPELASDPAAFTSEFRVSPGLIAAFRMFAATRGFTINRAIWREDADLLRASLRSEIARVLWDSDKYYEVWYASDPMLPAALHNFPSARQLLSAQD